jgi:hypothetical protein
MKFRLYKEHGALNSTDIFNAFEQGVKSLGFVTSDSHDSVPVIWSVLWQGRMLANRAIYHTAVKRKQPVVIIEVGNLIRGITWRISVNHVNQLGIFGNDCDLDYARHRHLNLNLRAVNSKRKPEILIAAQHERSLQWEGQPSMSQWVSNTVAAVRRYSDRPIVVRPHPRSPFSLSYPTVKVVTPQKIVNTYDDFNLDYAVHCLVNHNSGPGVQAAIQGTPVVVDVTSLASPVSEQLLNIENPQLPDRTEWFTKLCHTEWTREEIAQGTPLKRLLPEIEARLS